MSVTDILLFFGGGAAAWVLVLWMRDRHRTAYDRAMQKDFEYAQKHPGCSYDEAHRNREKVYRRQGL